MRLHVIPQNDLIEHTESMMCACEPPTIIGGGKTIVIHNSFDGREIIEEVNKILGYDTKKDC